MNIERILKDLEYEVVRGDLGGEVSALTSDSRQVGEGTAFVCIEGMKADGHKYAAECAGKGAALIVISKDTPIPDSAGCCVVKVKDSRYAFALMSCAFFGYPAQTIKVIGVTGTKGKTTTTYMIRDILRHAGHKVGLIGTIEVSDGVSTVPAGNTTPESYVIQEALAKMKDNGCDYCVMEVSSQGLMLHRTAGIMFEVGIFTNLEPDHIGPGEHRDFDHYLACKKMLFKQCRLGIVNIDDPHYESVIEGHSCRLESYGFDKRADLSASNLKLWRAEGRLLVDFDMKGIINESITLGIPGRFNVYNALAAIRTCVHFDVNMDDIRECLRYIKVKGRIEMVDVSPDFTLMIDYSHNAMALENVIKTLREYNPGRIVTMFGCGGNRSKLRRYDMGEVSGKYSDFTVITSDNPRDEEPLDIIADIKIGIGKTDGKYIEIPDRREAIRYCIENGQKGDIIILAGKGHEDYQEIKGKKYPMDERVIIEEILKDMTSK